MVTFGVPVMDTRLGQEELGLPGGCCPGNDVREIGKEFSTLFSADCRKTKEGEGDCTL